MKSLTQEVHICTSDVSQGSTGQVRIWRSSGQGQGHRSKKIHNNPLLSQRKAVCQHKIRWLRRHMLKHLLNTRIVTLTTDSQKLSDNLGETVQISSIFPIFPGGKKLQYISRFSSSVRHHCVQTTRCLKSKYTFLLLQ